MPKTKSQLKRLTFWIVLLAGLSVVAWAMLSYENTEPDELEDRHSVVEE